MDYKIITNVKLRVKIFESNTTENLQKKINEFFSKNNIKVNEIRYTSTVMYNRLVLSALIFYAGVDKHE